MTTKAQVTDFLPISPREYFEERLVAGFSKRNIKVYPAVQSYLAELLEHYLVAKNLFEKQPTTLAELYLKAVSSAQPGEKQELLKRLGDQSLYISGFFGDSLTRKLVDIDYYASLGGAAYATLAVAVKTDTLAKVYNTISERFLDFVDVLSFISQDSLAQNDQAILRLYDRYLTTGSELAREKLNELGVVTIPQDAAKQTKQN